MSDFPRPFSGGKAKKQKKDTANKEREIADAGLFAMAMKVPSTVKFKRKGFDNVVKGIRQGVKEGVEFAERTKEMGGPNMSYSPNKMESAKQEKYNLMHDMPVVKHASWMSKHSKSALRMGHKDSPAKKHCM